MKRRLSLSTRLSDFSQALTFDCSSGSDMDERRALPNAVLIDDEQRTHMGDFLHTQTVRGPDQKGDEDVVHNLDGRKRLITRSFQNWHTHLPMQLNARDFSDGLPLQEWLEKSIFNRAETYKSTLVLEPLHLRWR